MPRLVFEQSAIQAPIVRVPRDTLGGVSAPGQGFQDVSQSLFRLGQAEEQLNSAINTRQRETAGYESYLQYAQTQHQQLADLKAQVPDPIERRRRGMELQKELFNRFHEQAAEGGYTLEFLKHATSFSITTQNKFLTETDAAIVDFETQRINTYRDIEITSIAEEFTPAIIFAESDLELGEGRIIFEDMDTSIVGTRLRSFADVVNSAFLSQDQKNKVLTEGHKTLLKELALKAVMTAPHEYLRSNPREVRVDLPFVGIDGSVVELSSSLSGEDLLELNARAHTLITQENARNEIDYKQNSRRQDLMDDGYHAGVVKRAIQDPATVGRMITETSVERLISEKQRTATLNYLEGFRRERRNESDPMEAPKMWRRVQSGTFNPFDPETEHGPPDPTGFPTETEILHNEHLAENDMIALLKARQERLSTADTQFEGFLSEESRFINNLLRKSTAYAGTKDAQDSIAEFVTSNFIQQARTLPLDQRTPQALRQLSLQTLQDGVHTMRQAGFVPMGGSEQAYQQVSKFLRDTSLSLRSNEHLPLLLGRGKISAADALSFQAMNNIADNLEGMGAPPRIKPIPSQEAIRQYMEKYDRLSDSIREQFLDLQEKLIQNRVETQKLLKEAEALKREGPVIEPEQDEIPNQEQKRKGILERRGIE